MAKSAIFLVLMLTFVLLLPQTDAAFTNPPTFDLVTTSNLAGAADAVYNLHAENPDQNEDATSLSILIPAGYAVSQKFMTNKPGMKAMSALAKAPQGSFTAHVLTTSTRGQFSMMGTEGRQAGVVYCTILITEPTGTTQGKIEMMFTGSYSPLNRRCSGDLVTLEGFFINPSILGTYGWGPSLASPTDGPSVTTEPRPGYTQTITIVGTEETSVVTTVETTIATATLTSSVTAVQVTTMSGQTTVPQSAVRSISPEIQTETMAQSITSSGQFPTELMVAGVLLIVIVVAGVFFVLRRKK